MASDRPGAASRAQPRPSGTPAEVAPDRGSRAGQLAFLRGIADTRSRSEAATYDTQALLTLAHERDRALLAGLGAGHQFVKWQGEVDEVIRIDGRVGARIRVGSGVWLTSGAPAPSEPRATTLVGARNPLFEGITALRPGDHVVVSGRFLADDADCIRTVNLSTFDRLQRPGFVVRITAIEAARS